MEQRVSELLQKINDTYWNTYIEYLQSKKGDRRWVEQNFEWLKKTVKAGDNVLQSITEDGILFMFYKTIEENSELRSRLQAACSRVIEEYKSELKAAA
ncbi:MAG: hypothetical protein ACOC7U_00050 [Spirochaetota bacterium]